MLDTVLDYTNWKGERGIRRVAPVRVLHTTTEWHLEAQWCLLAYDLDKGAMRTFALKDVEPLRNGVSLPYSLWRHSKGGLYVVLGIVEDSTNGREGQSLVLYWSCERAALRTRAFDEFMDGRFVPVKGAEDGRQRVQADR